MPGTAACRRPLPRPSRLPYRPRERGHLANGRPTWRLERPLDRRDRAASPSRPRTTPQRVGGARDAPPKGHLPDAEDRHEGCRGSGRGSPDARRRRPGCQHRPDRHPRWRAGSARRSSSNHEWVVCGRGRRRGVPGGRLDPGRARTDGGGSRPARPHDRPPAGRLRAGGPGGGRPRRQNRLRQVRAALMRPTPQSDHSDAPGATAPGSSSARRGSPGSCRDGRRGSRRPPA